MTNLNLMHQPCSYFKRSTDKDSKIRILSGFKSIPYDTEDRGHLTYERGNYRKSYCSHIRSNIILKSYGNIYF